MNVYIRESATALAQRGTRVTLFTRRTDPDAPAVLNLEPNISLVHVPAGPPDAPKEALPGAIDEFAGGVLSHLRRGGGAELVHSHYWLSALAGRRVAASLGIPSVITFHTLARVKNSHGDDEPALREGAEDDLATSSDCLVGASPADAHDIIGYHRADPHRVTSAPPGVVHALFSPGSREGARWALGLDDRPIILFVGRIQALKGLDLAVSALAECTTTDAQLHVLGGPSGPHGDAEFTRIGHLIAAGRIGSRVHFSAPQPHHILSTWYRAADIVIVPSRSESFGLVALEGAACGRTVLASDVGGLAYVVRNHETGVLVHGRDPHLWAKTIDALLTDPSHLSTLGGRAAQRAATFTWHATAERLALIYAGTLAGIPPADAAPPLV